MAEIEMKNAPAVLHACVALGQANKPLDCLLAQAATTALAQAVDAAQKSSIAQDFVAIRQALEAPTTPKGLTEALLHELPRKYDLDALVARELSARRIALHGAGFVDLAVREGKTLMQDVVGQLTAHLAQADDDGLSAMRHVLDIAGQAPGSLQGALGEAAAQLGPLHTLWTTGKVDVTDLMAVGKALVDVAQADLTTAADACAGYVSDFKTLADGLTAGPGKFALDVKNTRAYANTLCSVLQLAGASDEAKFVAKAAGYVETAIQLQQSFAMLAAASTGWGAALAIAGLLNGGAGLGLFGGSSSQAQSDKRVLEAIAKLAERIDEQFDRVNAKLADISRAIAQVYKAVKDVAIGVDELLERTRGIEERLDRALLREQTNVRILAELVQGLSDRKCMAVLESGQAAATAETLAGCLAYYGSDMAGRSAEPVMQAQMATPDEAANGLSANFGLEASEREMWSYAGALRLILSSEYGFVLNVPPVHWPTVARALESTAQMRQHFEADFDALPKVTRDKYLGQLRTALRRHEYFVATLRGPHDLTKASNHPIFSPLLTRLRSHVQSFTTAWDRLFAIAAREVVDHLESGGLGYAGVTFTRAASLTLRNHGGAGATWQMFDSAAINSGKIPYVMTTFIPRPGEGDSGGLETTVTRLSRTLLRQGMIQMQLPGSWIQLPANNRFEEQANTDFRARLYSVDLFISTKDIFLFYDKGPHSYLAEATPSDPVRYIAQADGDGRTAGSEAIPAYYASRLQEPGLVTNARDLQIQRVWYNHELHYGVVSTKLRTETRPWGDARAGLEALESARKVAMTIRAVCRMGFEEVYKSFDPLASLFEGGYDSRLVDMAFLPAWGKMAAEVYVPNGPLKKEDALHRMAFNLDAGLAARDSLVPLPTTAAARVDVLEKALDKLLEASANWGRPFELVRIKKLFESTFPEGP